MEDGNRYSRKIPHKSHRYGRERRAGGPHLYRYHTKEPLRNASYGISGFTFVELMVVLVMIGMALAITVPMGVQWVADYKFSAGCRAFINSAQLVRIKSIGGPITINVSQVDKGVDDSHFVFSLPPFTTATPVTMTIGGKCEDYPPFQAGDYITVAGINNPDYLNGHIFLITDVASPWAVVKKLDASGKRYVCDWSTVNVTAKSCMDNEPGNCVKWPGGVAAPQTTTTGMIRVASCLRFVPFDKNDAEDWKNRVRYTVLRSGNSMECKYDPQWMDVKVLVPDPNAPEKGLQITDSSGTKPAPIVFDYAGATRNHMTYTVELRKMTRSESAGVLSYTPVDDKKSAPIVFSIMPTGRIRLGKVPNTYEDTVPPSE